MLIVSWLLGSIVGCTISHEIWAALTHYFVAQSKARIMQFRFELQKLQKGGLAMRDYLNKLKTISLASIGNILSIRD